ncbi:sensor histidine kinase [Pedobacter punctiformis]|nr:HAMP domain-containing sensor histidine kinase [Pedobacter sp. HCMS5-2]
MPIIIAATLIFHYKEWKYLVLVILTSFTLLFIETTPFFDPQANDSGFQTSENMTSYLLVVLVFYILTLVYFYMSYTKLKSDRLILISDRLLKSKIELGKQSEDLIEFSKASNHFIKSPVYISNFFAEKIEKGIIENKKYAELEQYFDLIQSSIDNEEIFINNMFDYNEIITITPKKEKVDLYALLLQSISEYKKDKKNIEFDVAPFNAKIKLDKYLLKKAFFVLFENAINYNLNKKPYLYIYSEHNNDDDILLNFKDNGIGIDDSFKDKIFEPFLRINDLSNVNGVGLGLTKVKKIAEILNGNVTLKNSSKNGSTFQLLLKNN